MELPKRKPNRLASYCYSAPGAYFVTVCIQNRKNLFWAHPDRPVTAPEAVMLSPYGKIVQQIIDEIPRRYKAVTVDCCAIMPNHIHLLLQIHTDADGQSMRAPAISTVVQQMKGSVSKQIGFSPWQKGFYDHVVRDETDYLEIWQYIYGNPLKWKEDHLYID